MKKILFLLTVLYTGQAIAQFSYEINFAGEGLIAVYVENLSSGDSYLIAGDGVLTYSTICKCGSSISGNKNSKSSGIKVISNQPGHKSRLLITVPEPGDAIISISDISGKVIIQKKFYLDNSEQEFVLSGIRNGEYLISVEGNSFQLNEKLECEQISNRNIPEEKGSDKVYIDIERATVDTKGLPRYVDMEFFPGDTMLYVGFDGSRSTIIVKVQDHSETITFDFYDCKDADLHNYPVVKIGDLLWMGASLRTTKNQNGEDLLNGNVEAVDTMWNNLKKGAWAYSVNNSDFRQTHGFLYNGIATISDSTGNICPVGWHISTLEDWQNLLSTLTPDSTLEKAWAAIKEADTTFWQAKYSIGTISWDVRGKNVTGFTARPAGFRYGSDYEYGGKDGRAYFWTSTSAADVGYENHNWVFGGGTGWNEISSNGRIVMNLNREHFPMEYGFQVRCVKNYSEKNFPDSGAIWNVQISSGAVDKILYGIIGDTTINDKMYNRLFLLSDTTLAYYNFNNYLGGLRKDDRKVYFKPANWEYQDILLYDFSASVGDTVWHNGELMIAYNGDHYFGLNADYYSVVQEKVSHIPYQTYSIKRSDELEDDWFEGIGSSFGLFGSIIQIPLAGTSYNLACYKHNDTVKYQNNLKCNSCFCGESDVVNKVDNPNHITVFPNPVAKTLSISIPEHYSKINVTIMDLKGSVIYSKNNLEDYIDMSDVVSGIYIVKIATDNKIIVRKIIVH